MRHLRLPIACFLLAALVGCGEAAPGSSGRAATRTIISVPGADLGELARNHLGGSTYDDGRGGDLLRAARQVMQTAPGFEAEFTSRSFGAFRQGKDVGDSREVMSKYKVTWARPNAMRAEVGFSNEGDLAGARIATDDGESYTVRAPGLLGLIPRKLAADDDRLKNARGHELGAVNPGAQVARLSGAQAVWTVIGEGRTPAGQPTVRIGVTGVGRLDAQIDREEIEVEAGTMALYQYAAYVGLRRVLAYDFAAFRWTNAPAESLGR